MVCRCGIDGWTKGLAMEQLSHGVKQSNRPFSNRAVAAGALAATLLLGGCAVEVENTKPAQVMAQQALPTGSVPLGWRVFQERCAGCHGPAALGGSGIPNLLPLVRDMTSRQFIGLVLYRYDWQLASNPRRLNSASRETLVDSILQGKEGQITMPAWQGEPVVKAHIMDLYAYLSARSQGSQGPGRPNP